MATPQATAPTASAKLTGLRVRFAPAAYTGKADKPSNNVADAVIVGMFGKLPIQMAGFVVAKKADGKTLTVYMPKTAPFGSAPAAIQPARIAAPDGIETDTPDNTLPAPGGRAAVEAFESAMLAAYVECTRGAAPKFGTEIPLVITGM